MAENEIHSGTVKGPHLGKSRQVTSLPTKCQTTYGYVLQDFALPENRRPRDTCGRQDLTLDGFGISSERATMPD
jgi:hypothetical protein